MNPLLSSPLIVYGSKISYFTGKLESFLRYKEIDYKFVPVSPLRFEKIKCNTGVKQVPAVVLNDGRWMTDTTPMLAWFDANSDGLPVIPEDALQAFFSFLVEDYADEWLWRPAMHFRWSYPETAELLSGKIADEILNSIPLPRVAKAFYFRKRQQTIFVKGDGVSEQNRGHVEAIYYRNLSILEAIFQKRTFLLGTRPTLADYGYYGSMFRHFSQDPAPAKIMKECAPNVYQWTLRMWDVKQSSDSTLETGLPTDWSPILLDIGNSYLPYLNANAEAFMAGEKYFTVTINKAEYKKIRTSQYRVGCLERLQAHFNALSDDLQILAKERLVADGCWVPLWAVKAESGIGSEQQSPFHLGHTMTGT